MEVSEKTNYIGLVDPENRPSGLGCVYSEKETYYGNYSEGSLEVYGRMMFENGDIYHGELIGGVFFGVGIYYSPMKNTTSVMFSDEQEQVVDKEMPGYVMITLPMRIGN